MAISGKRERLVPVKTDTSRQRVCALDLGSRNFKAVIGFRNGGSVVSRLLCKHTMHLGKEIADNGGVIGSAKLAEVRDALEALVDVCRQEGASTVLGIATRAVREARNGADVVALAAALGIDVEIADGSREAAVGYLAATGGAANRLVSDFGSRSLEIAWRLAGPLETGYVACGYEDAYTGHLHGWWDSSATTSLPCLAASSSSASTRTPWRATSPARRRARSPTGPWSGAR